MNKSKGLITFMLLAATLVLGFITLSPNYAYAALNVERIYGESRIDTAIEISKFGWDSADAVIIARADNPADALSSASLSSGKDAPILLTHTNYLPESVIKEITRLGAKKVYLLGGTLAISQEVQNKLSRLPIEIKRIQGSTRFETAANINIEAGSALNDEAIIVNGFAVADALSASSNSAINHLPIYLATKTAIPVSLPSNIKKVTIYGGEIVIGKEVYDALAQKGISVKRIAGDNRYKTNIQAADSSLTKNAILVRGTSTSSDSEQYPDAVAGAGLAYKLNANIILSHPDIVIPEVAAHFQTYRYPSVFVLGGEFAINTDTVEELLLYPDSEVKKVFNYTMAAAVFDPVRPVLYSINYDDNTIRSYNYQTGETKSLALTNVPEQLYVENNKLYITLVHRDHSPYWWNEEQTGGIAIVELENFQLTKTININLDPFDIVVDKNGYIYVASGSGQHTYIKSYSEATGMEVSSAGIRNQSFIEMRPDQSKIFAINTDVTPRDISVYTISNGKFTGVTDSPYHGDFDLGYFETLSDIKISPDGRYLFNTMGHVFTGNLLHAGELEIPFSDIAFDLERNHFYTGISNMIFQHQYDDFLIYDYFMANGYVLQLYRKDNMLYILTVLKNEITGLENFALEAMPLPRANQNVNRQPIDNSLLLNAVDMAEKLQTE